MSETVKRSGGLGATIAVALAGLAIGGALGWWQGEERVDAAALEEEMAAALRTIDPVERRTALLDALAKMNPETLPAIRAGFESEFRLADSCSVPLFAAAWSSFDPMSAFDAALRDWSHMAKRGQMTTEVAYTLGLTGRVDRAKHLVSKLTTPRVQYPTWGGLVAGMLRNGDMAGATDLLVDQPDSSDRNRIVESFLTYFVVHQDLDGAIAWVDAIPADTPRNVKKTTFRLAARYIASLDPERAAAWIEAQPDDAAYAEIADLAVAEEWIEHDPHSAMAWLMARTTPGDRTLAMRAALRRFVERDPAEAAAWMEQQDPLGDVELGIPILVRAIREERPAEALAWAERISDPEDRDRMVAFVAGEWMASDPEAARAWVAAKQLPPTLQEKIESERLEAAEGANPW